MTMIPKSKRNIAGLREALFETLDELRAGTTDAPKARAVVCVAQVIINSVQVQMGLERAKRSSLDSLPDLTPTKARGVSNRLVS